MRLLSDDELKAVRPSKTAEYEKDGVPRSNLRYGYVVPSRGCLSRSCPSRG